MKKRNHFRELLKGFEALEAERLGNGTLKQTIVKNNTACTNPRPIEKTAESTKSEKEHFALRKVIRIKH
jgi:hypothetical protein